MKLLSSALLTLAFVSILSTPAQALEFGSLEDSGNSYVSTPIQDDYYAAGNKLTIDSTINGDAILGGAVITLTGNVTQDLTAAGGRLQISGPVGDDVRIAGGEVTIDSNIIDDVILLGGDVVIGRNAVIGGDVYVGGGNVQIDGVIQGKLIAAGADIHLNGVVNGGVFIDGENTRLGGTIRGDSKIVSSIIDVKDTVQLYGTLKYWNAAGTLTTTGFLRDGATAEYDASFGPLKLPERHPEPETFLAAFIAAIMGYSVLATALFLLLIIFFSRTLFAESAKQIKKDTLLSFLVGLGFFCVTPLIALAFFVSIIGFPIALMIGCFYVFALVFVKPLAALVLAHWWEQHGKSKKKWGKVRTFFAALAIYIAFKVVLLVPIIGWIVVWGFICVAFGSLEIEKFKRLQKVL